MYMKLSYVPRGDNDAENMHWPGYGICACVTNEAPTHSLGSSNSRYNNPGRGDVFAYFKVDDFDGLENITTEVLVTELLSRTTVEELIEHHLSWKMSNEFLANEVRNRLERGER